MWCHLIICSAEDKFWTFYFYMKHNIISFKIIWENWHNTASEFDIDVLSSTPHHKQGCKFCIGNCNLHTIMTIIAPYRNKMSRICILRCKWFLETGCHLLLIISEKERFFVMHVNIKACFFYSCLSLSVSVYNVILFHIHLLLLHINH
jgi:hypothetical protein